ncbi:unnamed protein product [Orchesella dallaii]|uniref:Uncharacterized protein n=1 Tax=Orchesella dallaii TaxID=48710 RepID=A0ABP1RZ00_9HEXA
MLVFYKVLVGQSTSLTGSTRWLTGGWVLAGMFLTYNFQGNNIDQLTSPLDPKKLETFEEIFSNNLTLFSLPSDYASHEFEFKHSYTSETIESLQRDHSDDPLWDITDFTFSYMFLRQKIKLTENDAQEHLKRLVKSPMNFIESVAMIPFQFYVKQISKCGRDVFVDKLSRVNRLHYELTNIPDAQLENIAASKTPYGRVYPFLVSTYSEYPAEYFARRFSSLIQSGIAKLWKDWKFRVDSGNYTVMQGRLQKKASFEALSISGNIAVVFYLHLLFLAMCVPPFL